MDLHEAITAVKAGHHSIMVKCPAHDDGTASLAVTRGNDHPVVLTCHAGCDTPDVLAATGLDWDEVCAPLDLTRNQPIATYSYTDEAGDELFQVVRYPTRPDGGKDFRQRHRVAGEWVWNLRDVRRVLYRLPRVVDAVTKGQIVVLVEGEKDVLTAEALGLTATTNPMGASAKWLPDYTASLRGATVYVVADNDVPGQKHAREVAAELREAECTVRTFETALPGCKDLTDHIAAGGTVETLVETTTTDTTTDDDLDATTFLDLTFTAEEFVIPGTLAHEERVLITGWEGHGKSTLLRQIGMMVAVGIHPWTHRDIPPKRVLLIDAENGKRQMQGSWQDIAGLCARHDHPLQPGMLRLQAVYLMQPDLTSPDGRLWFLERVMAFRPDLIVLGPVQNLTARDVKDDEVVRKFKRTVDMGREVCGSAVIMEHHTPHRMAGDTERPLRPYGSSLFMKWPDFGFGMRPVKDSDDLYDFKRTRLPRERSRQWPERLRLGTPNTLEFPWEVAPPEEYENVRRLR